MASAPGNPEPYAALAQLWKDKPSELAEVVQGADSLRTVLAQSYVDFLRGDMDGAALAMGSVTGVRPDIAWADAPWFSDERFLGAVSADALAEAAMRTMDYGHDLDTETMRERFRPWFQAVDVVSARFSTLSELIELAREMPNDSYRNLLIDHACAGPALPAELVAEARHIRNG
ncbi:hypothetical protein [Streptomyces lavenduligriseus]|uniref:Uncharacterized protein n=1 Tax=Streptomyces lavenduligriseus TaxID=67315 RepID=A0ABT0NT69_9ACTN|nr:hypothetical protein [Streptomyces lavenduligriseus]MCL3994650.1 hypothetical protein [Streptomyces lavenduligriseus]